MLGHSLGLSLRHRLNFDLCVVGIPDKNGFYESYRIRKEDDKAILGDKTDNLNAQGYVDYIKRLQRYVKNVNIGSEPGYFEAYSENLNLIGAVEIDPSLDFRELPKMNPVNVLVEGINPRYQEAIEKNKEELLRKINALRQR